MKCSLIIPYFQRKKLLLNTLAALNTQQHLEKRDYEVIIIDDGSDDLEFSEITSYAFNFNLEYYKFPRTEKSCAAFARNRGIEKAKGEVLIFLDCDQIVRDDFCFEHLILLQNCKDRNVLQFGTRRKLSENESDDPTSLADLRDAQFKPDPRHKLFAMFSHNAQLIQGCWQMVFSHNTSCYKELFERLGGYDENFKGWGLEDIELAYRFKRNGVKIVYNPNIEVIHQYHYSKTDPNKFQNWFKNLNYFLGKFNELPAMLQLLFIDCFVKEPTYVDKNHPQKWVECFYRFENMQHELIGKPLLRKENHYFFNPSPESLAAEIEHLGDKNVIVTALSKNYPLIAAIQTEEIYADVKLCIV
jgi:glycosyltransferase involved in cell wall biosynthesis